MSFSALMVSTYLLLFVLLIGGSFYFFALKKKRFADLKDSLGHRSVRSDLKFSLISVLIFAFSYWLVVKLGSLGLNRLYFDYANGGMLQLVTGFVLLVLGYDAYFYWSHRLLHLPWWYKNVHHVHHRSHHPTPLSAMAFHPLEAVLQALYLPLVTLIVPTHASLMIIAPAFIMVLSIIGHMGFEFLPTKFRTEQVGKHFGSSTHHHLHHRFPQMNFGFLFMFWDHCLSTKKEQKS